MQGAHRGTKHFKTNAAEMEERDRLKGDPGNQQSSVPSDCHLPLYVSIFKDLFTCTGLNAKAKCSFNCAICFLCHFLVIF